MEVLEDPGDIPPLDGENPGDFLDGFLQGTRSALTEEGRFNLSITMQRVEALHGDAQVEAPFLGQSRPRALQESIQEVPRVLPLEGRDITGILEDLHKGHEEVVHAITQLLDVGVLIG